MSQRLENKMALVTGGAQGIGGAIATAFAREGADVAILDRQKEKAIEKAQELERFGVTSAAVWADVKDESQLKTAIETAMRQLGRIDILVNNAGINSTSSVVEMTTDMWDEMISNNLRSVFLSSRAVLGPMIERKHGRIINISSQLAHKGSAEMAHYTAAKAGVIGFTKSLAYEVAIHGVTVNAICPGPIDTDLLKRLPEDWKKRKFSELPIGRAGQVEEIAPTAVMLASEEGAYYVGTTLNPNGGDVMV